MEHTMLKSFTAAANFKNTLRASALSADVRECIQSVDETHQLGGSLLSDAIADLNQAPRPSGAKSTPDVLIPLSNDVVAALDDLKAVLQKDIGSGWVTPQKGCFHKSLLIGNRTFTVHPKSTIPTPVFVYQSGQEPIPGILEQIFSVKVRDNNPNLSGGCLYFMVTKSFRKHKSQIYNPFSTHSEFGANIWRKELYSKPTITPVVPHMRICHGIMGSWDSTHYVMKPLLRVRPSSSSENFVCLTWFLGGVAHTILYTTAAPSVVTLPIYLIRLSHLFHCHLSIYTQC